MAWLRIDDAFDTHPKVVALGSNERRWTWVRILIYTCRHRTDVIPECVQDVIPKATSRFLEDCASLGLVDVKDGVRRVHDWSDYQAGDPKKAARQRRWRNAHVDESVDVKVDGYVDRDVVASRVGARARTRPVPVPIDINLPSVSPELQDAGIFVRAEAP